MQNMIFPSKLVCPLDRHHVQRLLDDADPILAAIICTDRAGINIGRIEADRTERYSLLHLENGFGQADRVVFRCLENMVGKPRCRFRSDPGQSGKLIDQPADGPGRDAAG